MVIFAGEETDDDCDLIVIALDEECGLIVMVLHDMVGNSSTTRCVNMMGEPALRPNLIESKRL